MKYYKATDENMCCRGYQFTLNEWHECEGELELCKNGFHICKYPSGPWSYYSDPGTRLWEVEAEGILDAPVEPGSDHKLVCRRIRFGREIVVTRGYNTGFYNTGFYNTGDRNAGHGNTGDRNTGADNAGHGNAGDYNAGDYNAGHGNTGNRNTGHVNTGHGNTGRGNTGHGNAGDYNTGHGNACDYSSGFFCSEDPYVRSFDVETSLTVGQFKDSYPEYVELTYALVKPDPIPFNKYKNIPGITPEKLVALHKKHQDRRR